MFTPTADKAKLQEHVEILESQLSWTLKSRSPFLSALAREGQHREAAVAGKAMADAIDIIKALL
jgi:hypothetical protein